MITGIFGLPGDGKTYYVMTEIERLLRETDKVIVTNISCFPERIAESLHDKYGKSYDVHSRFRFLNAAESRYFWRFRDGYKLSSVGEGKESRTLWESLPEGFKGVVYVIDEVHVHFNARAWAQTGADALEYCSQHRKLGDEVFLISQRPKQVDSQMRGLCGTYVQMRNLAHRQLKWMGISWTFPAALHARAYPEEWKSSTSEDVLMWTKTFKVDPKFYGSWYDTAAGVGIKGNAADTNRNKPKGVPFWVLVAVFAVLVAAAFGLPWVFKRLTSGALNKLDSYAESSSVRSVASPVLKVDSVAVPVATPTVRMDTNGLPWQLEIPEIRSFSVDRHALVTVTLRDGRKLTTADGIKLLGKEGFVYKGRVYPLP